MQITPIHPWNLSPTEAIELQHALADHIQVVGEPTNVRFIAGVDVSSEWHGTFMTAGVVVWDSETNAVVETVSAQGEAPFPYIPGLLSFREIPLLLEALSQLKTEPDVLMVDGHGIAHPRGMGIAAHLGLCVDVPTIGVAKSKLCGNHESLSDEAGARVPLLFQGKMIGIVLRTKKRSKPVYVSPGNRIAHDAAVKIVQQSLRGYRLPEPTRLAHRYVNEVRRQSNLTNSH